MGSALSGLPSDLEVLLPCSSCRSSRNGSWAAVKNTLVFKFRGKAIYKNVLNIYKPEPIKLGVWQQRCAALPCEEQTWILTLLVSPDAEYKGCRCSDAFPWSWLLGNACSWVRKQKGGVIFFLKAYKLCTWLFSVWASWHYVPYKSWEAHLEDMPVSTLSLVSPWLSPSHTVRRRKSNALWIPLTRKWGKWKTSSVFIILNKLRVGISLSAQPTVRSHR